MRERSIQAKKHVMARLAAESPALTAEQILAESVRAINHRESVRGLSPIQYVLGRATDEHGRFFAPARDLEAPGELPMATETMERDQQLRLTAEKASFWIGWQLNELDVLLTPNIGECLIFQQETLFSFGGNN